MKTLPLLLLCATLGGTAAAQPRPAARKTMELFLRETSDSITRWCRANPGDPVAQNLSSWWTDDVNSRVEVRLLRADTAARSAFRRRVHDCPLIRLGGFDPDTMPWQEAPRGAAPPDCLTMTAAHAFYPPGTENVTLTIRYRGDEAVWFGSDYTLSRFQHGRWEIIPVCEVWNALLTGLGRPDPPPPGTQRPAPPEGYTHDFEVWLAPKLFPAPYGRYRVSKAVYAEHPRRDWLLSTEFTISPFVPFTPLR